MQRTKRSKSDIDILKEKYQKTIANIRNAAKKRRIRLEETTQRMDQCKSCGAACLHCITLIGLERSGWREYIPADYCAECRTAYYRKVDVFEVIKKAGIAFEADINLPVSYSKNGEIVIIPQKSEGSGIRKTAEKKSAKNKKKKKPGNAGRKRKQHGLINSKPRVSSAEAERERERRILEESNRRIAEIKREKERERIAEQRLAEEILRKNPLPADGCITRVVSNIPICFNDKHVVIDVQLAIPVVNYEGNIEYKVVNGARCKTCGKIYMMEADYQRLRKIGPILCRIVQEEYWGRSYSYSGLDNLNDESILHMFGYNVGSQDNLSDSQRCAVLEFLVDNDIITRYRIGNQIDFNIRLRESNPRYQMAISKWESDKKYILNYKTSRLDIITVGMIRHNVARYKR